MLELLSIKNSVHLVRAGYQPVLRGFGSKKWIFVALLTGCRRSVWRGTEICWIYQPTQSPAFTQYHIEDWVQCIRSRERCNADVEYGLRSTTLCYLVNIVREVGVSASVCVGIQKPSVSPTVTKRTSRGTSRVHAARATSCPS